MSRATGESIGTIAGMGFVELRPIPFEREPLMQTTLASLKQLQNLEV